MRRCRLVAEQRRARAAVRQAGGGYLAHVADRVRVAIHFAGKLVDLRTPRTKPALDAEYGLCAVELAVTQDTSRQPIERSPTQARVAAGTLIVRRSRDIVGRAVVAAIASVEPSNAPLFVAD